MWYGYLLALKEARELGVTSVQVPGSADLEAYEKLQKVGETDLQDRYWKSLTADPIFLRTILNLKKNIRKRQLDQIRIFERFMDGTIGSGTALMFEPFNDNPSTSGLAFNHMMRWRK